MKKAFCRPPNMGGIQLFSSVMSQPLCGLADCFYTFPVDLASAIYTSSGLEVNGVDPTAASQGLASYVLNYGI